MMKDKFAKLVNFLKETRAETKKVAWPDRRYVTVATMVILVLVVVCGLFVMFVDLVFVKIFAFILK